MEVHINYSAVAIAALANVFLGLTWYGILFKKDPAQLLDIDLGGNPGSSKTAYNFVSLIIASYVMSWVLANMLILSRTFFPVSGAIAGIIIGFLNWLVFLMPFTMGSRNQTGKPWKIWFINAGYYLVSLCLMGVIVAVRM